MAKKPLNPELESFEGRVGRIARIIDDTKGEKIVVLDLRGICDFADAFVIVSSRSSTHLQAILGNVQEQLREEGLRPIARPSVDDVRWGLLDYGDVIVHVFEPEARLFYDLESLWGDAEELPWQQLASA